MSEEVQTHRVYRYTTIFMHRKVDVVSISRAHVFTFCQRWFSEKSVLKENNQHICMAQNIQRDHEAVLCFSLSARTAKFAQVGMICLGERQVDNEACMRKVMSMFQA